MTLGRRDFLRYGGALAGAAVVSPKLLTSCRRLKPNIIVITADDMRFDHLAYLRQTPGLFANGVTYSSCRLNVAACQPYRAGFLSGQNARRNGVYGTGQYLSDPTQSIGPWMQTAGYTTGMIGKYPFPYGGTALAGWNVQRTFTAATEQLPYGYSVFDGTSNSSPPDYQATYVFNEAQSFITQAPRPWFCWVTPTNPHVPLLARPQDMNDWLDVQWPIVEDDLVGKPSWMQAQPSLTDDTRTSIRGQVQLQLQELDAVDDGVASVMSSLQSTSQLDNTIVIFTSDNGVMYGEHRMWRFSTDMKNTPYDPAMLVPLLVRGPGFGTGTVTAPVCGQDLTRTILAVAKSTPAVPLDGIDLRNGVDPDRALLHERSGTVPPAIEGLPGGVGVTTRTRQAVATRGHGSRQVRDVSLGFGPQRTDQRGL